MPVKFLDRDALPGSRRSTGASGLLLGGQPTQSSRLPTCFDFDVQDPGANETGEKLPSDLAQQAALAEGSAEQCLRACYQSLLKSDSGFGVIHEAVVGGEELSKQCLLALAELSGGPGLIWGGYLQSLLNQKPASYSPNASGKMETSLTALGCNARAGTQQAGFTHLISPQTTHPSSFENEYRKIGWWKGPYAAETARASVWAFWTSSGRVGAEWLAKRLRREYHAEALDAASSLLADIGHIGLKPILGELNAQPTPEQAQALLGALRWMPSTEATAYASELRTTIGQLLRHDDSEVRETAAKATAILGRGVSAPLLRSTLREETDAEVRDTIIEALSEAAK